MLRPYMWRYTEEYCYGTEDYSVFTLISQNFHEKKKNKKILKESTATIDK